MTAPAYVSHDAEDDWLTVLEFGRVDDGQARDKWDPISDAFAYLRDRPGGRVVGFTVLEFSEFDLDDPEVTAVWEGPRFDVPLLGLSAATAGEIVLAARPLLSDSSTINRSYFHKAIEVQSDDLEQALALWLACLEAGNSMAHFAVGYTLYDLGRYREAYRHLRHYADLAPDQPWTWCWLGKAAAAIGEVGEARAAYAHAVDLDDEDETDARELLEELGYGHTMEEPAPTTQPEPAHFGERFERALAFAARTHRTQTRKGSGIPYIGHLLGVASLVIEDGGSEDETIAALLHDAAEDQGGEAMLAEIRATFGDAVGDIVLACSDTLEETKPPWQTRKETYLEHLRAQPPAVLRVSLADKLFNARAILRDYLVVGDELWDRFRAGREGQLWYYDELADVFAELSRGPMASELREVVDELRQAVAAA